jgi:hypothetical protein
MYFVREEVNETVLFTSPRRQAALAIGPPRGAIAQLVGLIRSLIKHRWNFITIDCCTFLQ